MPNHTLLLVLLLGTCGPAPIHAQPQANPIRTVENVVPITSAFSKKWFKLSRSGNFEAADQMSDSIALAVVGQEVTAAYLVDRDGTVWNLGVMELPFLVYTFTSRPANIAPHVEAINSVAREYSEQLVTFVLAPPPTEPDAVGLLEDFNDNVVILFDDHLRTPAHTPEESCIYRVTHHWPTAFFINAKRRIVGLQAGVYASIHPTNGLVKINRKFARNLTKRLRKQVKQLVKHD